MSPGRLTDSENLRSPSEVLYAVADSGGGGHHYRTPNMDHHHESNLMNRNRLNNDRGVQTSSDLRKPPRNISRASREPSREDLFASQNSLNRKPNNLMSRSLERYKDYKENNNNNTVNYKARVKVKQPVDRSVSPSRFSSVTAPPNPNAGRKPFKTTINTATDNIEYRVDDPRMRSKSGGHYRRPQSSGPPIESEHYKVPRGCATPVEYLQKRYNGGGNGTDSEASSYRHYPQMGTQMSRYNSRLNKDGGAYTLSRSVPRDPHHRERSLRKAEAEQRSRASRAYSNCSTSPDRDTSPRPQERYQKPRHHIQQHPPVRSYSHGNQPKYEQHSRSPSHSPARPPRSRASPSRELTSGVSRRISNSQRPLSSNGRLIERGGIQRIHNDIRNDNSKDVNGAANDRMAKFTEYRGQDINDRHNNLINKNSEMNNNGSKHSSRRSSVHMADQEANNNNVKGDRGQSLPPGANIDSIRDFYQSSQYKSMYALPPSPSRPAPVLERAPSSNNLRSGQHPQGRSSRVSISEGELTDEAGMRRASSNPRYQQPQRPVRRVSTKRPAPSPPGTVMRPSGTSTLNRRVVSSDRLNSKASDSDQPGGPVRRVVSSDRGLQQQQRMSNTLGPPTRRSMTSVIQNRRR